MPAVLTPLKPAIAADRVRFGRAVLADIREPDEFARLHSLMPWKRASAA